MTEKGDLLSRYEIVEQIRENFLHSATSIQDFPKEMDRNAALKFLIDAHGGMLDRLLRRLKEAEKK
jgi:hypothetical protein